MSDLIDKQSAINALEILADKMTDYGMVIMKQSIAVLRDIRPEDPERKTEKWSDNEVARLLVELIGDPCACNINGNDEWLSDKCDYRNVCPHTPYTSACWEQFLKYRG